MLTNSGGRCFPVAADPINPAGPSRVPGVQQERRAVQKTDRMFAAMMLARVLMQIAEKGYHAGYSTEL
jgi:hypothetical protein